jgi:hypothetical protein
MIRGRIIVPLPLMNRLPTYCLANPFNCVHDRKEVEI